VLDAGLKESAEVLYASKVISEYVVFPGTPDKSGWERWEPVKKWFRV
jgi:hypothetical protein